MSTSCVGSAWAHRGDTTCSHDRWLRACTASATLASLSAQWGLCIVHATVSVCSVVILLLLLLVLGVCMSVFISGAIAVVVVVVIV
jgi:hypothetical protein